MTAWDAWSLLGEAAGITERHGLALSPQPEPDEVMITVCAEDGARAFAVIPRTVLAEHGFTPSLLAGLDAGLARNRTVRAKYSADLRARKEAGDR